MLRRILVNPLATLVLLAILAFDAWSLPTHPAFGGRSGVGTLVHQLIREQAMQSQPPRFEAVVAKDPTGLRVLQPNFESWDEATRLMTDAPNTTALMIYMPRVERSGAWALTREQRSFTFEVVGGSGFSPEDWRAARTAALRAWFNISDLSPEQSRVAQQNFTESSILWSGYLHNFLSLLCFFLLLGSLHWIPRTPAYFRARRGAARMRRGLCPSCAYNLSGLPKASCPECGQSIAPTR